MSGMPPQQMEGISEYTKIEKENSFREDLLNEETGEAAEKEAAEGSNPETQRAGSTAEELEAVSLDFELESFPMTRELKIESPGSEFDGFPVAASLKEALGRNMVEVDQENLDLAAEDQMEGVELSQPTSGQPRVHISDSESSAAEEVTDMGGVEYTSDGK